MTSAALQALALGSYTAKIAIDASEAATLNSIPIDIPEFAAPGAGYAWQVIAFSVEFTAGLIEYDFSTWQIKADGATAAQAFATNTQTGLNWWNLGTPFYAVALDSIIENAGLQVSASSDDGAGGDGTAVVHVTAILVKK